MFSSKRANRNNSSSKKGQGEVKEQFCSCYKGDEVGDDWIQCDFCDGWYHENCSGLPEVIISQLSQAKYLLFRCSLCLDNKKVEETTRKVIKDTIQEMLPSIMKTALEQLNLGELSRTVTELKGEVKSLKHDRINDRPREKTFSEAVNSNDPGSKTFSAHVLQTQRLDTVFNDNSLVSSSKPVRKKREVKIGTGEIETFKGVEKPPPRKHIYIGRVSTQHDIETVRDYCNEEQMGLLHLRKISSEESRYHAFHCVFEMKDIDLEDPSLWPKNVVIGRYRLNDSSREWLKTLPKN